jgi:hypothetical protein
VSARCRRYWKHVVGLAVGIGLAVLANATAEQLSALPAVLIGTALVVAGLLAAVPDRLSPLSTPLVLAGPLFFAPHLDSPWLALTPIAVAAALGYAWWRYGYGKQFSPGVALPVLALVASLSIPIVLLASDQTFGLGSIILAVITGVLVTLGVLMALALGHAKREFARLWREGRLGGESEDQL